MLTTYRSNGKDYQFKRMVSVCDIACDDNTYFLTESDAKEFGEKLAKAITDCEGFRYKSTFFCR